MKKFFTLLIGIILGVVLVVGGVAGFGYYYVTKDAGMNDLASAIGGIEFSDEIKQLSILKYLQNAQEVFKSFQTTPIGDIEDALGLPLSAKVAELLGIEPDAIRASNLEQLPNAIVDSFTVETLERKFDVKLPDMPLFQTEEFRTKPLLEAFNSLSDKLDPNKMTVADLETNFGIKLSDNPVFQDPTIANTPVGNLGAAINDVKLAAMLGVVYQTDVDAWNASRVADEAALAAWKAGKKSYAAYLAEGGNPVGIGGFQYFDTKEEQSAYLEAYNAQEPDPVLPMLEKWSDLRAREQQSIYDALYPGEPETPDVPGEPGGTEPAAAETPAPQVVYAPPVAPTVRTDGETAPKVSSALILRLSVNKLGDMTATGGSDRVIDQIVNNSTLGEIIDINPDDTILYSLKDSKISTLDRDIRNIALNKIMTVDANSSAAMKYLVSIPLRDDAKPWKTDADGKPLVDGSGKKIPNYLQAKNENGDFLYELNEDGSKKTDADGNPIPIYVYATINTIDTKIKQMVIDDILPPVGEGETQNVILSKVSYSTLDSLNKDLNEAIDTTTIGELVKPAQGETQSQILKALGDTTISGLNARMKTLTINDVIAAPADPMSEHVVIRKLRAMNGGQGVLISEIGTSIGSVVDDLTLGELISIPDGSSAILLALKDTKVGGLSAKIDTLTLEQMVGEDALYNKSGGTIDRNSPKGVLGLIDYKNRDSATGTGTTTLQNIGKNATTAIKTATLQELRTIGLLPSDDSLTSKAVDLMIQNDTSGGKTTTVETLPGAIIELMLQTKIGVLIDKGLITVTGNNTSALAALRELSVQSILNLIASGAIQLPTAPNLP